MPDVLDYRPPEPTLVAPPRRGVIVGWAIVLILDLMFLGSMWTGTRGPQIGTALCVAATAILPLLQLLRELGIYNPRLIPDPRQFGLAIEQQIRSELETRPDYQAADITALAKPQQLTMAAITKEFIDAGFTHRGDYVNATANHRFPQSKHLVRVFSGDGPSWIAAASLAGNDQTSTLTLEFQSEFEDGRFLVTSDAKTHATRPHDLADEVLITPPAWSVEQMMRRHTARLEELETAGQVPRPLGTLGDVWAMNERERLRNLAWCQTHGFVTPDHVRAVMEFAGWIPELQEVAVKAMANS